MRSWDCGKFKNPTSQENCEHRDHCQACPTCKGAKWHTKLNEKREMYATACPRVRVRPATTRRLEG